MLGRILRMLNCHPEAQNISKNMKVNHISNVVLKCRRKL